VCLYGVLCASCCVARAAEGRGGGLRSCGLYDLCAYRDHPSRCWSSVDVHSHQTKAIKRRSNAALTLTAVSKRSGTSSSRFRVAGRPGWIACCGPSCTLAFVWRRRLDERLGVGVEVAAQDVVLGRARAGAHLREERLVPMVTRKRENANAGTCKNVNAGRTDERTDGHTVEEHAYGPCI
jgi:hypothetical protein